MVLSGVTRLYQNNKDVANNRAWRKSLEFLSWEHDVGKQSQRQFDADVSCSDWVAPPDLQVHLQSVMEKTPRLDELQSKLANIIETNIIPRLLLANRREFAISPPLSDLAAVILSERVGEFSELVVNRDAGASIAYFQKLRGEGVSVEALFQDLLAPTARRLGELWDEDINDFMDVTRGMGHLQQLVHVFSSEFCAESREPISNRRALMMTLPGEQHTLGLSLINEHFRREGWRVWSGPSQSIGDIVTLAEGQYFEVVGFSASILTDPTLLADQISTIREASLNQHVRIFIGGHPFSENPDLVLAVGADATATDGREALLQVSRLIGAE